MPNSDADGFDRVPLAAELRLERVADFGKAALVGRAVEIDDPDDLRRVGPDRDGPDEPRLGFRVGLDLAEPEAQVPAGLG